MNIFGDYRPLFFEEENALKDTVGYVVDYNKVQISRGNWLLKLIFKLNGGRSFTLGYHINTPDERKLSRFTLLHEIVHVWQYDTAEDWKVILGCLWDQLFGRKYELSDYECLFMSFDALEREQQAQAVELYWMGVQSGSPSNFLRYRRLALSFNQTFQQYFDRMNSK